MASCYHGESSNYNERIARLEETDKGTSNSRAEEIVEINTIHFEEVFFYHIAH